MATTQRNDATTQSPRPKARPPCAHVTPETDPAPAPKTPEGCEECLQTGDRWVHLRLCLACGHVGCCNDSPNKHAIKHFHATGHPLIRSYEPGENWWWCYVDEAFLKVPDAPPAPSRAPFAPRRVSTTDDTAFPILADDQISTLASLGQRRSVTRGEYLFCEGDTGYDFFVVVSGAVDIFLHVDGAEQFIVRHGSGRFVGELNMLTGMRMLVSARVAQPGEVIVIPREALRRFVTTHPTLGDTILTAFLARRALLLTGAAGSVRVIGSRFSPDLLRIREFLVRSRIPHEWLDPDGGDEVEAVLHAFSIGSSELPVVIANGTVLRRPTPGVVAAYLGLTAESLPERCFDLIVVGTGPAGLASAVYGASEGLTTLGLESLAVGGQAGTSTRIENYLGFATGISGADLTQRAVVQAERFGAYLAAPCTATSLHERSGYLSVGLSDGTSVMGRAVVVATGARYRRLAVERLTDFEQAGGVYYAATEMEARMCASQPVVVVGGGNSAGQAALFLAEAGSPVTIVIRGDNLANSMSRYLIDRIDSDPRIAVRTNVVVAALDGDPTLSSVRLESLSGSETLACAGLFSFIGADPETEWLNGIATLDARGFILTDRALGELDGPWSTLGRQPLPYEASCPGLFAIGDVRSGSTKRVAAAVGEGSAVVGAIHSYFAFVH